MLGRELGISTQELSKRHSESSYDTLCSIDSEFLNDDLTAPATDGVLGADDLSEDFFDAIRRLPARDQIVLALYYWERLPLAEIGLVLAVSELRVSQLMTRGWLELRRRLAA